MGVEAISDLQICKLLFVQVQVAILLPYRYVPVLVPWTPGDLQYTQYNSTVPVLSTSTSNLTVQVLISPTCTSTVGVRFETYIAIGTTSTVQVLLVVITVVAGCKRTSGQADKIKTVPVAYGVRVRYK